MSDPAWEVDPLDALEAKRRLRLLRKLKPQQRLVLWLRVEGYSYEHIQPATGKSYTWVNRHITEGRAALRRLLECGDCRHADEWYRSRAHLVVTPARLRI